MKKITLFDKINKININKKIIILITFVASGISFFSWKLINQKDNQPQIVHQEETDLQKSNFAFWIIFGIILFIATVIIAYLIKKRILYRNYQKILKKKKPNNNQDDEDEESTDLSTKPADSSLKTKKAKHKEIKPNNKYKNWVCGIVLKKDNTIQLVLCESWNSKNLIDQIFDLDIESKIDIENTDLKELYKDAKEKNEKNIRDFLNNCLDILKYITTPFLIEIKKMKKEFKKKQSCKFFQKIADAFETKEHSDNRIVLASSQIIKKRALKRKKYYEVTEIEGLGNDLQNKDSLAFFKKILFEELPIAYSDKASSSLRKKTTNFLFQYSYSFYHLISDIISDFKELLEWNNDCKTIDINQIKTDIEKIDIFFRKKDKNKEEEKNKKNDWWGYISYFSSIVSRFI